MTAIIYGTARFWGVVNSTQILPFRCSHLATCVLRTSRLVVEQRDDYRIDLLDEKAAQLVQPHGLIHAIWRVC
jgi:hypothetical protein